MTGVQFGDQRLAQRDLSQGQDLTQPAQSDPAQPLPLCLQPHQLAGDLGLVASSRQLVQQPRVPRQRLQQCLRAPPMSSRQHPQHQSTPDGSAMILLRRKAA